MPTTKSMPSPTLIAAIFGLGLLWLTGCGPPGPRALLEGRQLIDQGDYAGAVSQLKLATSLMPTNALAWNYLGLACHHASIPNDAYAAYERALKINPDLVWIHFDLGCLLLEQNRPDAARDELTAFILHQGKSAAGWVKLGAAQLRLGDLSNAELSLNEALRLNPQDAETMNDMGVVQLQRRRLRDATGWFDGALKLRPDYGPARLNLAIAMQQSPGGRALALQNYQQYLALDPRPANWDAVNAVAQQLDQELNPPSRARTATEVAAAPPPPPPRTAPALAPAPKPEPAMSPRAAASVPARTSAPPAYAAPETSSEESGGFTVTPLANPANPPQATQESASDTDLQALPPGSVSTMAKPPHHGFFSSLNPANLFRRGNATDDTATPVPPIAATQPDQVQANDASFQQDSAPKVVPPPPPRPVTFPRYAYLSPSRPSAGNRPEALLYFNQALQAQREQRYSDAIAGYRAATETDPAFLEAQANLGLAAYEAGELPVSLSAYETALAISPESFNARFNFALALRKAGYLIDAAKELERLLIVNKNETPEHLAATHLMLASLYSEQFHQPRAARPHYLKVLELDPANSQATAIRYWLRDNP
jgi:tetratricopeptide (TPR) repeat protein